MLYDRRQRQLWISTQKTTAALEPAAEDVPEKETRPQREETSRLRGPTTVGGRGWATGQREVWAAATTGPHLRKCAERRPESGGGRLV